MKRFICLLSAAILMTTAIFSQEFDENEEYDDGYVYEQNGSGDQFLKIELAANFPLNFHKQLYTGAAASIGYYRFLTKYIGLGGDIILGYNVSIGKKAVITAPITFGALIQPYVGKFEFPITMNIGLASTSCQSMTYFPSFTAKASAGAFYRYSETWSFGLTTTAYWIPQWVKDPSKNFNGFFTYAGLSIRYHF